MHGVYVPEAAFDLEAEADRLKAVMDTVGNVRSSCPRAPGWTASSPRWSSPASRGARGTRSVTSGSTRSTPAQWFAKQFAARLGAEKVLVQKSGYFARSAPADETDLLLIKSMTDYAVGCALRGISGVVGHDEENGDQLRAIEFDRIKGGKKFDICQRRVRRAAGQDRPAGDGGTGH